ncbi:MAG: hypothetical protein ACR5KV_07125 [Wolbachia sp.]
MNKENYFKIDKLVRDHTPEIMRSHGMIIYDMVMEKVNTLNVSKINS